MCADLLTHFHRLNVPAKCYLIHSSSDQWTHTANTNNMYQCECALSHTRFRSWKSLILLFTSAAADTLFLSLFVLCVSVVHTYIYANIIIRIYVSNVIPNKNEMLNAVHEPYALRNSLLRCWFELLWFSLPFTCVLHTLRFRWIARPVASRKEIVWMTKAHNEKDLATLIFLLNEPKKKCKYKFHKSIQSLKK